MRTAIAVFVALTATLAIAAATFVLGMRRKNPLVLNAVRRSGRAMKPLVLRKAGRAGSPTAVVEHGGRTSQRQYQTPVVAAATSDGFVIALPYGQNTDWLKNVLAAGRAKVRYSGNAYNVDGPEIVDLQRVGDSFATRERRLHKQFRVREALTVRRSA